MSLSQQLTTLHTRCVAVPISTVLAKDRRDLEHASELLRTHVHESRNNWMLHHLYGAMLETTDGHDDKMKTHLLHLIAGALSFLAKNPDEACRKIMSEDEITQVQSLEKKVHDLETICERLADENTRLIAEIEATKKTTATGSTPAEVEEINRLAAIAVAETVAIAEEEIEGHWTEEIKAKEDQVAALQLDLEQAGLEKEALVSELAGCKSASANDAAALKNLGNALAGKSEAIASAMSILASV